jgi:hypothetical protein
VATLLSGRPPVHGELAGGRLFAAALARGILVKRRHTSTKKAKAGSGSKSPGSPGGSTPPRRTELIHVTFSNNTTAVFDPEEFVATVEEEENEFGYPKRTYGKAWETVKPGRTIVECKGLARLTNRDIASIRKV